MVLKKTKKRVSISIDRDIWALVIHFLPPSETRSSFIQKAFTAVIIENIELLVEMIENSRETNPKECFRYEEWIMRVGLSKYYNEARKKWFENKNKGEGNAQYYDNTDEVKEENNGLPIPPVEPPYSKYHQMLNKHIHKEPRGFSAQEMAGIKPLDSGEREYVHDPSDAEIALQQKQDELRAQMEFERDSKGYYDEESDY